MEPCDLCGKKTHERELQLIKSKGRVAYVCRACRGTYDEDEIFEQIKEA